jgi:hypothetical protein
MDLNPEPVIFGGLSRVPAGHQIVLCFVLTASESHEEAHWRNNATGRNSQLRSRLRGRGGPALHDSRLAIHCRPLISRCSNSWASIT